MSAPGHIDTPDQFPSYNYIIPTMSQLIIKLNEGDFLSVNQENTFFGWLPTTYPEKTATPPPEARPSAICLLFWKEVRDDDRR